MWKRGARSQPSRNELGLWSGFRDFLARISYTPLFSIQADLRHDLLDLTLPWYAEQECERLRARSQAFRNELGLWSGFRDFLARISYTPLFSIQADLRHELLDLTLPWYAEYECERLRARSQALRNELGLFQGFSCPYLVQTNIFYSTRIETRPFGLNTPRIYRIGMWKMRG